MVDSGDDGSALKLYDVYWKFILGFASQTRWQVNAPHVYTKFSC